MGSEISKILTSYRKALDHSRGRYEALYQTRGLNAAEFYEKYANRLVRNYAASFLDLGTRRRIHRQIRRAVGSDCIDFVAIDGSCYKDEFNDFVVFSACAYGAKGQLELKETGDRPKIRYRRWELDRDVSMVAYVPVPFAQLADVLGEKEDFLLSDQDRINLASVHTKLMQLAEIYLAYNIVTSSSIDKPRLILMDLLPSSVMASIASSPESVNLSGYEYDRRRLDFKDIVVSLAHPFSEVLDLPNRNRFRLHQLVIADLYRRGTKHVDLKDLADRSKVKLDDLRKAVGGRPLYGDPVHYKETSEGIVDSRVQQLISRAARVGILAGDHFTTEFQSFNEQHVSLDVRHSWEFTVGLFRSICDRLFRRKEADAMVYQVAGSDGRTREHWLDPTDIEFLTAIGIRALIEACWEQRVILLGIAKDSASRYFTRNYMGILRHAVQLPELSDMEVGRLPWTDRMFFEFIASQATALEAPWATVEFDSAFMTLWIAATRDGAGAETNRLGAVQEHIVAHMNLFARSLSQFFLSRNKATTLMGHVVFVDRLLMPELDRDIPHFDLDSSVLEKRGLAPHNLGKVYPLGFTDTVTEDSGQDISMYLMSCLTRNHYPEVIGYPDPLHKADWGAKTLGNQLRRTIRSSEVAFRSRPLSRTFRAIRDSYGRR